MNSRSFIGGTELTLRVVVYTTCMFGELMVNYQYFDSHESRLKTPGLFHG